MHLLDLNIQELTDEKSRVTIFPLPPNTVSSSCSGLINIYFQEGIWHEQVKLYEVRDKSTNDLLGHFYLDLFPRDGKYSHQVTYSTLSLPPPLPLTLSLFKCVYPLQPSFTRRDGSQQRPTAAYLGNTTKPTATRPSLLKSSDARTFFHEFGHLMHCLCTKSSYALFSWAWTAVPWMGMHPPPSLPPHPPPHYHLTHYNTYPQQVESNRISSKPLRRC